MKIRTRILALTLAVLMAVSLSFSGCGKKDELEVSGEKSTGAFTKEYFEENKMEIIENSVDTNELFGLNDEFFNFFKNEKLESGLAIDAAFEYEDVDVNLGIASLNDPAKIKVDVVVNNEVDASVYVDEEMLSVKSDLFLGEAPISLKFEGFDVIIEKLANSELGKMLEIPSAEVMKEAFNEMGINDEYFANIKKAYGEYMSNYSDENSFLTEYTEKVYDIVGDSYGEVEETVSTDYNGEEFEAYTVSVTIDKDDILAVFDVAFDMYAEQLMNSGNFVKAVMAFDEASSDMYDTEGMVAEIYEIKEEMHSNMENVTVTGVETLYFNKADGKYVKSDMELVVENYDASSGTMVIKGSEYVVDNGILFNGVMNNGEDTYTFNVSLKGESTDEAFALVLDADIETESESWESAEFGAGFVIDKAAKTYEIYVRLKGGDDDPGFYDGDMNDEVRNDILNIKGSVDYSDDEFTFSVDEISSIDLNIHKGEFPENKITIKAIEEVSAHEGAKDIFELDQNELFGIIARISMLA